MPFCIHCGKENPNEAKFCAGCGKAIDVSVPSSSGRKQIYDGVIHKCPSCGEVLNSFVATCPSCGYELRGVQSSQTVKTLADKLDSITASKSETKRQQFWREFMNGTHKADEQKIEAIRSFVIPTTKEDVLEFITYALGNINISVLADDQADKAERAINEAWVTKLDQAYSKASVLFGDDPAFANIKQMYLSKQAEIKKAYKTRDRKDRFPLIMCAVLLAIIIFGMVFLLKGRP